MKGIQTIVDKFGIFLSRFVLVGIFNYFFAIFTFALFWTIFGNHFSYREISYGVAVISIVVSIASQSIFTVRKWLDPRSLSLLFFIQYLNLELSIISVPRISRHLGIEILYTQWIWVSIFTLSTFVIYWRKSLQSTIP